MAVPDNSIDRRVLFHPVQTLATRVLATVIQVGHDQPDGGGPFQFHSTAERMRYIRSSRRIKLKHRVVDRIPAHVGVGNGDLLTPGRLDV